MLICSITRRITRRTRRRNEGESRTNGRIMIFLRRHFRWVSIPDGPRRRWSMRNVLFSILAPFLLAASDCLLFARRTRRTRADPRRPHESEVYGGETGGARERPLAGGRDTPAVYFESSAPRLAAAHFDAPSRRTRRPHAPIVFFNAFPVRRCGRSHAALDRRKANSP